MKTGEKTLLKQDKILGGYNQKNYFSESCLFSLNQKTRNTSGQSPLNDPYEYQLKQHPLVVYKGVHFMDWDERFIATA